MRFCGLSRDCHSDPKNESSLITRLDRAVAFSMIEQVIGDLDTRQCHRDQDPEIPNIGIMQKNTGQEIGKDGESISTDPGQPFRKTRRIFNGSTRLVESIKQEVNHPEKGYRAEDAGF